VKGKAMSEQTDFNLDGLDLDVARQIDAVCRRFEADWRAGARPPFDGYLAEVPDHARSALRAELEGLERELQQSEETGARGTFEIESTAMMVGQGLESGSTGEPGCSQLNVRAGFDPARPQAPRLARWRASFYQSRLLDVLTHIVVLAAGSNLLGALAVILPVILGLVATAGDKTPTPALGLGFLEVWAMALVLGDGALRWGQPRAGRILRWISPYQGACCVFLPCWILGSAILMLAAWAALHAS
jgi:hypothetical protein